MPRMSDVRMNHRLAHTAIMAGLKKAEEMETKMCLTVMDDGANLVAFMR